MVVAGAEAGAMELEGVVALAVDGGAPACGGVGVVLTATKMLTGVVTLAAERVASACPELAVEARVPVARVESADLGASAGVWNCP